MKTSVIRQRVADFLKRHPAFETMSDADLLNLAGSGRVRFHESHEYLFRQGQAKGQFVWMIQQGRVELIEERPLREHLHDVLGEGDLLGLERFSGDGSYQYSARTASDVILYGLAADLFESLVSNYPSIQRFLSEPQSLSIAKSWLDAQPPPIEFLQARLVALPCNASNQAVISGLITADNGVVAFVDPNKRPTGIVSSMDLVAARERPVTAVAVPLTTRTAVREMLRARTEELAITADGTLDGPLTAILTASDLALFCGRNPARLVGALRNASSTAELLPLRRQANRLVMDALTEPKDVDDCWHIATQAGEALADTCIRMAHRDVLEAGLEPSGIQACWLMFGASARGDLLGGGAPTIAAVYDDGDDRSGPLDSMFFTALAGQTLEHFAECDLSGTDFFWPKGAQPGMPLSEWKRMYTETIQHPIDYDLYARREFFDMAMLSGDGAILRNLKDHITHELSSNEMVLALLANDTLANLPPLTFFGGLVLELDGEQHNSFNIDSSALLPIAAAARVFAIAKLRLTPASTLERLQLAMSDFPQGAAVLARAADAFRIALYYRALAGSPEIHPGKLGKFDQHLLKMAFASIQRLLEFTEATLIPVL